MNPLCGFPVQSFVHVNPHVFDGLLFPILKVGIEGLLLVSYFRLVWFSIYCTNGSLFVGVVLVFVHTVMSKLVE